jgi:hypothetical protein
MLKVTSLHKIDNSFTMAQSTFHSLIMIFVAERRVARIPVEGRVVVCEESSHGLLITP